MIFFEYCLKLNIPSVNLEIINDFNIKNKRKIQKEFYNSNFEIWITGQFQQFSDKNNSDKC